MAQQISHLQRHMIEDMKLRNMSPLTQRAYICAVKNFSTFFRRSPVSEEPWPRSEGLDRRVLFAAADQCGAAQPQGVSSASRLLGQLLTSLVSTSVR